MKTEQEIKEAIKKENIGQEIDKQSWQRILSLCPTTKEVIQ